MIGLVGTDLPRASRTILASLLLCLLAAPSAAGAQEAHPIRGVVLGPTGDPVAGARVLVDDRRRAITDERGRFHVDVAPGERRIRVEHPDFRELSRAVGVEAGGLDLELRLDWVTAVRESVTVAGIRAGDAAPVTTRELDAREIGELDHGQDVPALLQHTPSMTWYSDSGRGSNYSYFSLRGIQQSRINMTFDGAPLNDPAEHAVYFNNFHDFLSQVDSIQIQRGVGTSSVGSPSYGGSVNFASGPPATDGGGDVRLVAGSDDTVRASVGYHSGRFGDGFSLSGRLSWSDTDGYRDHSGSEHRTGFLKAAWQGGRSQLRLTAFSGREESQLSYLAVDPDTLAANPRANPMDEAERDDFGQDFAQLKYTRSVDDDTLLTGSLYYNGAQGVFLLWDDPVAQNDLLEFGIDQHFVGSMLTATRSTDRTTASVGLHYNDFTGDHTLDATGGRLYANTGSKRTANAFGKLEYRLGRLLLFGDLQLRWARFAYDGAVDLGAVDWTFLDPRAGLRYELTPRLSAYASVGRAQREPARLDLLHGEDDATVRHDLEAVRPESVVDVEAGVDYRTPDLTVQANVYAMEFRDEIALTGQLSEIGLPLRENVQDSYRRGVELDLRWRPARYWTVTHSLNVSRNRIGEWTQFHDVYGADGAWVGSEPRTYSDVPPLLTPELVANLGVAWAGDPLSLALSGRHVADAQLDNTGLEAFRIPSWTSVDLRAAVDLRRWWPAGSPRLTLFVDNLLDDEGQYGSGYSYQFLVRGAGGDSLDGIPYYYPRADRSLTLALEVDL